MEKEYKIETAAFIRSLVNYYYRSEITTEHLNQILTGDAKLTVKIIGNTLKGSIEMDMPEDYVNYCNALKGLSDKGLKSEIRLDRI